MNHVASSCEWWVLGCVGGQLATLDRDRDAEFAVEVPWPEMRARLERWLRGAEALLNGMGPEDFQAISKHPAGERMNRRCLLHVVEHMGLHLGHIELTTDWWKAAHGGTLTGDAIAAG
jgi:hypothetical protein